MSASCHTPRPITNRKIQERFTLRRATGYGGFNALSDFVHAAGIDAALTEAFAGEKAPWATYPLPETLRHLLDGYLLGVERVWHFADLEQEPLLCAKRDRERLPDYTLLYRDLTRSEGRWRRLDPDAPEAGEVSEFRFARQGWSRPRRVIVTRRREAANPQGHLWDAAGYNYAAYVTDLPGPPADVVACYDKRADMEKAIHELKEDFGIDRISSSSFGANAADLELKVLAFNLLVLYQRQALGWTILHRAKTVRRRLLAVAGQLIRTAGRWVLKLAADWGAQRDLLRVRAHLATLGP